MIRPVAKVVQACYALAVIPHLVMPPNLLLQALLLSTALFLGRAMGLAAESDRTAIAVEALTRLKDVDLNTNATVKAAVMRVLEATRGTANFVRVVRDFKIQGQTAALLEIAADNPKDEAGIEAMKLILANGDLALVGDGLNGTNSAIVMNIVEALGNTRDKEVITLLLPLVRQARADLAVRKQAVRSLALTQAGAAALLRLGRDGSLANDLKLTASEELNQVRWEKIKADAAEILPLPRSANTEPLPAVSELLKMRGDPKRGEEVFTSTNVGCINCHRAKDKGVDFAPALSEIGTKLGKDALFEAILAPSAGISLGYEPWQIELKNGDEAYGLITSETEQEIVVKDAHNVPMRIKKAEIAKRQQSKVSIMPADLQKTMSTQDLVDLVEFLATLKKVE
jgi:putative heme-binding domain-containing protein